MAQFGRAPRSGRGGRKFESCRLDEDELPGNVEKSGFPGVFLCENAPLSFRRGALTDRTVLLLSGGDPQAASPHICRQSASRLPGQAPPAHQKSIVFISEFGRFLLYDDLYLSVIVLIILARPRKSSALMIAIP